MSRKIHKTNLTQESHKANYKDLSFKQQRKKSLVSGRSLDLQVWLGKGS